MGNELKTSFEFDVKQAFKNADAVEKRLISLNKTLNDLGKSPTSTPGFDKFSNKLNLAEKNVSKLTAKISSLKSRNIDVKVSVGAVKIPKIPKLTVDADIKVVKFNIPRAPTFDVRANVRFNKLRPPNLRNIKVTAVIDKVKYPSPKDLSLKVSTLTIDARRIVVNGNGVNLPGGGRQRSVLSGAEGDFLRTFGVPLSIGAVVGTLDAAIDKSIEVIKANRQLASSATEAGLAYEVLAEKNLKAAESFGLSNVAAASVTAKIQQLATFSGKPEQFDLLQKRFADLGAAKGIDSRDLNVLIGTILSGQDEGLNRLGISDPGQLYKAHAKEIGKAADQLTQYEKVQAAVNAVVEKGAIFDGTATLRMNSLEGATAKMTAQWENFTTGISTAATGNLFFQNSLDLINTGLLNMSNNIDEVRKKLRQGLTPEQIAKEEFNKPGNQILGGISSFGNVFLGLPFLAKDAYTDGFGKAFENYKNAIDPKSLRKNLEAQRAGQIRNQIGLDENQKKDAESENFKRQTRNLADGYKARIDSFINPVSDGVSKARRSLDDLNKIQRDFNKSVNSLGTLEKAAIREQIGIASRKFYTEDAKESVTNFLKNPDVPGARQNLSVLTGIKKFLPEDTFDELSESLNKFLAEDLEKAKEKIEDLGKKTADTFNSLFAKSVQSNPIASVFLDSEKALNSLRENLRGLDDDLLSKAIDLQKKLNSNALFEAKLDSDLEAFDLRERAKELRKSPKTLDITDPNKFFDDYIEFYSKKLEAGGAARKFNASITADGKGFLGFAQTQNSPFTKYHSNIYTDADDKQYTAGFSQSDARTDLLNSYDRITSKDGGFGGFSVRQKSLADLTAADKDKFFAESQSQDNQSFNDRLKSQLSIIESGAFSPEQQAIADKKLLGLTSALNPDEIRGDLKEKIALANEREAGHREAYERDLLQVQKDQLIADQMIAANTQKLLEIAEKEGSGKIKALIEIVNKTNGKASVTGDVAGGDDVKSYYEQYEDQ